MSVRSVALFLRKEPDEEPNIRAQKAKRPRTKNQKQIKDQSPKTEVVCLPMQVSFGFGL
jgi:hypothetical protein